jgi:hypothetical protein
MAPLAWPPAPGRTPRRCRRRWRRRGGGRPRRCRRRTVVFLLVVSAEIGSVGATSVPVRGHADAGDVVAMDGNRTFPLNGLGTRQPGPETGAHRPVFIRTADGTAGTFFGEGPGWPAADGPGRHRRGTRSPPGPPHCGGTLARVGGQLTEGAHIVAGRRRTGRCPAGVSKPGCSAPVTSRRTKPSGRGGTARLSAGGAAPGAHAAPSRAPATSVSATVPFRTPASRAHARGAGGAPGTSGRHPDRFVIGVKPKTRRSACSNASEGSRACPGTGTSAPVPRGGSRHRPRSGVADVGGSGRGNSHRG